MKHIERLKKITSLGYRLVSLKKSPFELYKLKLDKFDRAFLTQMELDKVENQHMENKHLQIVKDLFFSAVMQA